MKPMVSYTPEEFAAYRLKQERRKPEDKAPSDAVADELALHDEIKSDLKARGFMFIYHDPTRRTTCRPGIPDFVVALARGKTLWLECKAKGGKLSPEQMAIRAWLQRDGHSVYTVFSFREFVEAIEECLKL